MTNSVQFEVPVLGYLKVRIAFWLNVWKHNKLENMTTKVNFSLELSFNRMEQDVVSNRFQDNDISRMSMIKRF